VGVDGAGQESRAVEVFNEALGILGRMQQDGRIDSFDVWLLSPNGEMDGFIMIRGSAQQIADLRADEEFQRNTLDAQLAVDGIRHLDGYTNDGIAPQM
jgi:hypothetical protein